MIRTKKGQTVKSTIDNSILLKGNYDEPKDLLLRAIVTDFELAGGNIEVFPSLTEDPELITIRGVAAMVHNGLGANSLMVFNDADLAFCKGPVERHTLTLCIETIIARGRERGIFVIASTVSDELEFGNTFKSATSIKIRYPQQARGILDRLTRRNAELVGAAL